MATGKRPAKYLMVIDGIFFRREFFLIGSVVLIAGLFSACTPDYVYIRNGQSEGTVRQDYVNCTEQQFKVSGSTSECMENKGYQAMIIERPFPESPPSLSSSPQVLR